MGKTEEDRVQICGDRENERNTAKKKGHPGAMVSKFKFLKHFKNNYPFSTFDNLLLFTSFIIDSHEKC